MFVVYKITNNVSSKYYIGSTNNPCKRFERHKRQLLNGCHHSLYFQRVYNKHKESIVLVMEILVTFETESEARHHEQELLNTLYEQLLNVSKHSCGGDILSTHPEKQRICAKISETLKRKYANKEITSLPKLGENNSNFKHGGCISIEAVCTSCGNVRTTQVRYSKNVCANCRAKQRTGEKNPFYGKAHSEEFKQKTSERVKQYNKDLKNSGISLPTEKPLYAFGVLYNSCTDAAKALSVSAATITHRVNSKNWDYRSIYYADTPKKFLDLELKIKDFECIIDGVVYTSVKEASKSLNTPYSTIVYKCNSDKPQNNNYLFKRPTSIEREYQKVFSK